MMISARNQIDTTIERLERGAVNTLLHLKTTSGTAMTASVTNPSTETMRLTPGDRVIAFFKASHVLIATGWAIPISARNCLEGKIASLTNGAVNCEVSVMLEGGDRITAIITHEAARNLALQEGDAVAAIIKASDLMIAKHV